MKKEIKQERDRMYPYVYRIALLDRIVKLSNDRKLTYCLPAMTLP